MLLGALSTQVFIIADRDYLSSIGEPATKALFETSEQKAVDALLRDKKSRDRKTLLSSLRQIAATGDISSLDQTIDYIASRRVSFKTVLSAEEQRRLENDLDRLRSDRCLVLKEGEIEDYLPMGVSDLRDVVAMTTDPNWVNRIPTAEKRVELAKFLATILELPSSESARLEQQMERGEVSFPVAPVRST